MLSLHGVLEHGLKLFLRFTLAELGSNSGDKLRRFERKGNGGIGAKVQSASTLERASFDEDHDVERGLGVWARFKLRHESAATEVGRGDLGYQNFGGKSQHLIDGQSAFGDEFVALSRQRASCGVKGLREEIEDQDTHHVFDAQRHSAGTVDFEELAGDRSAICSTGSTSTLINRRFSERRLAGSSRSGLCRFPLCVT